ncbi:fungal specific transcription factor domain-containing protein [Colletotrichum costaricense]|uniref:Fungal specific transcription factor domain-containing protein n=1 Tax=Colletotrichum costaricense TaxID=1209916 RepID=A0AAI9YIH1_9PEZI|nr:fungal specific transcription factor domain-containing protein [Colletotrichum costaricense]KAK1511381.1 fungal specific transcription factor domain-containing protein [Colletotrichum costaricense]
MSPKADTDGSKSQPSGPALQACYARKELAALGRDPRRSAVVEGHCPWDNGLELQADSFPATPQPPEKLLPVTYDTSDHTDNIIQQELDSRANITADRAWVLQSAISLVANFVASAQQPDVAGAASVVDGSLVTPDEIPSEVFYILFLGQSGRSKSPHHWPDHISTKTLERMCRTLSSGIVSGQTSVQNKICVLYKATTYSSSWLRFCEPGFLCDTLQASHRSYAAMCEKLLKEIDLVSHPSLGTLQALLSGTLSMLVVRPSSLPHLGWNAIDLVPTDPNNPLSLKARISVRLARVQDACLPLLMPQMRMDANRVSQTVASLEADLQNIHQSIMELRDEWTKTPDLALEWDTTDFTYYAVLTTVLRLDKTSLHDQNKRDKCLEYAREALLAMQRFQVNSHLRPNATTDFFSWTVLSYPLTPFFALFCNVVATSNLQDLELLAKATMILSQIKEQCTLSMNLFRLFTHFIDLCTHLDDIKSSWPRMQSGLRWPTHGSDPLQSSQRPSTAQTMPGLQLDDDQIVEEQRVPCFPTEQPISRVDHQDNRQSNAQSGGPSGEVAWRDGLVWELFNLQPSIESFDLSSFDWNFDAI